jgi:hypothetical protein
MYYIFNCVLLPQIRYSKEIRNILTIGSKKQKSIFLQFKVIIIKIQELN